MTDSKLKHSYSLTSLSSRFLSHNNKSHLNTSSTKQNVYHQKEHVDQPEGDDYGFLSGFREQQQFSSGSKGPPFSSHVNGAGGGMCSSSVRTGQGHQPLSWSGQPLTSGKRNPSERETLCGCEHNSESGKGVLNLSQRLGTFSLSTNKLNGSCQALNTCGTSGGGQLMSNGFGHMNNGYHPNTFNSFPNGNAHLSKGSGTTSPGIQKNGTNNGNPANNPTTSTPSVRVRRTLSCYVKHPQQKQGFRSLLDTESASTLNVTSISEKGEFGGSFQHPNSTGTQQSSFNPICEFSPYSSLSSNDLLRLTSGGNSAYFGDRKLSDCGTVFFHDNPVDCGCSVCFQAKIQIILKVSQTLSSLRSNSRAVLNNGTTKILILMHAELLSF